MKQRPSQNRVAGHVVADGQKTDAVVAEAANADEAIEVTQEEPTEAETVASVTEEEGQAETPHAQESRQAGRQNPHRLTLLTTAQLTALRETVEYCKTCCKDPQKGDKIGRHNQEEGSRLHAREAEPAAATGAQPANGSESSTPQDVVVQTRLPVARWWDRG